MDSIPKRIRIYSGPGAGERSFADTQGTLQSIVTDGTVSGISAAQIRDTTWHGATDLFVMPGGRDLPYCEELNGAGTDSIKQFVAAGGNYLGFCAGAYFACQEIAFESGSTEEVSGKRELGFFPGLAIGSALGIGTYSRIMEENACLTRIALKIPTSNITDYLSVYFDGGCYFQGDESQFEVLARYADLGGTPPAIVHCRSGLGHVILSGPHPEFLAFSSQTTRPDLARELEKNESIRRDFIGTLLLRMQNLSGMRELANA